MHILYRKVLITLSIIENIRDRQILDVFAAGGLPFSRSALASVMRSPSADSSRYRRLSYIELKAFLVGFVATSSSVPGKQLAEHFLEIDLMDRDKINLYLNFLDELSKFVLSQKTVK